MPSTVVMLVPWHEPRSVHAAEIVRWRNFCSVEHHDDMMTLLAPVFYTYYNIFICNQETTTRAPPQHDYIARTCVAVRAVVLRPFEPNHISDKRHQRVEKIGFAGINCFSCTFELSNQRFEEFLPLTKSTRVESAIWTDPSWSLDFTDLTLASKDTN